MTLTVLVRLKTKQNKIKEQRKSHTWLELFSFITESYTELERSLPALTGVERKEWATVRKQYFSDGVNADSLAMMEKALFHVNTLKYIQIDKKFIGLQLKQESQ